MSIFVKGLVENNKKTSGQSVHKYLANCEEPDKNSSVEPLMPPNKSTTMGRQVFFFLMNPFKFLFHNQHAIFHLKKNYNAVRGEASIQNTSNCVLGFLVKL